MGNISIMVNRTTAWIASVYATQFMPPSHSKPKMIAPIMITGAGLLVGTPKIVLKLWLIAESCTTRYRISGTGAKSFVSFLSEAMKRSIL